MNFGITAQYGFLYQRLCFVLTVLERANTNLSFSYEGKDDIDVSKNDSVSLIRCSNETLIQAKSGVVDSSVFYKIFGNWILNFQEDILYEVFLENSINFDVNFEDFLNWTMSGEQKSRKAIANQVFRLYQSNKDEFTRKAQKIFSEYKTVVLSISEIENKIYEQFSNDYCNDIQNDKAKEKRCEMLMGLINKDIDNALKNKNTFVINYPKLMYYVGTVKEFVGDNHYEVNILELKKASLEEAKKTVEKNNAREVKQLSRVNESSSFIIAEIVNELMYKDFRDIYVENKGVQISNIEQIAKDNYDNAVFSFSTTPIAKELFEKTVNSKIENDLLPKGNMYNRGCYTFLTGEDIDEDLQITWEIKNEQA